MDLENLATAAVKESISLTNTMSPFINDGDKEPVWDGHIYIYTDKSKKKENIKKVPVQVKGKRSKNLKAEIISYSLGVSYLRDYLDDGGVFFFVVYVSHSGKEKQIYYAALLPIKLRIILSGVKDKQKTKSFELRKFPDDNDKKTIILLNFYEDMQKQTSFRHAKLLSQEELFKQGKLESVTFSVTGYGKRIADIRDLIFQVDDIYMYANIKGSAIPQPLEEIPLGFHMAEDVYRKICVNGEEYYNHFHRVKSRGYLDLTIGKSVHIKMNEEKQTLVIEFKPTTILEDALVDIPFILAVAEFHQMEIGGTPIVFDEISSRFTTERINALSSNLGYYRRLDRLFEALHLRKNRDIGEFTKEDHKNTARLIDAILEGKTVSGLKKDIPYVALLDYADTKLLLVFKPTDIPGTYRIKDFFADKSYELFRVEENGERLPTSKYMNLKADDFLSLGNVDYKDIIESFIFYINEPYCMDEATHLLLQIIHAFDKSKDKRTDILEHAEYMAKWLMEIENVHKDPVVTRINYLQIQKRKRDLKEEEVLDLINIAEGIHLKNKIHEKSIKICANLLMDNQRVAKFYFEQLDKENQTLFRSYPIWRFHSFDLENDS